MCKRAQWDKCWNVVDVVCDFKIKLWMRQTKTNIYIVNGVVIERWGVVAR